MKIRSAFLTTLFLLIVSPLMAAGTYTYSDPTLSFIDGTEGTHANFADAYLADVSGGWGVVNEVIPGAVYIILANIEFGDGSTPSYFKSLNQMIYFEDGFVFERLANATLQVGDIVDGEGANGGCWSVNASGSFDVANAAGDTFFYGNTFENRSSSSLLKFSFGNVVFNNCTVTNNGGTGGLWFASGNWTMDRVNIHKGRTVIGLSPVLMADVLSIDSDITLNSADNVTFSGLDLSSVSQIRVQGSPSSGAAIGMTGEAPVIVITEAANFFTIREKLNIHINDKTGANLEGATVTATSFGNIVHKAGFISPPDFYRCIIDHTSGDFLTDFLAGKWEVTSQVNADLAGVTGAAQEGEWIVGIDYTAAAEEFSELTDADGNIDEQTLTYHKWVGTSEALLSYSPHTFTATKAREGTVEILNVTVDSPIDWTITLTIGDKWPLRGMKRVGY